MAKEYLPTQIDPQRFAETAAKLNGFIPLNHMERLGASALNPEGEAEVSLEFGIDEDKIKFIRGHIQASLNLQCQRCMGALICEIMSDFAYGMVNNDAESKQLPSHYDPIIVKNEELNIYDMLEEEMIINMPIVPMHDPENCEVSLPIMVSDPKSELDKETNNPFKVIEALKIKSKPE